jgi:hypothetical protein
MRHGVYVDEEATVVNTPQQVTSGIQFVVGTAPIHLTDNPSAAVNVPFLCNTLAEVKESIGYSREDMEKYTLCQSAYWNFEVFRTAPVIFVNVLDPDKHVEEISSVDLEVSEKQAVLEETDVLRDSVQVTADGSELSVGTDYITSYDDDGFLLITVLSGGAGEKASSLSVTAKKLDPSKVTYKDIIGGYDSASGKESGLQLIRLVFPMFGITAATILSPGYSQVPSVGAVMEALCEDINGTFRAETVLDLDTETCKKYEDVADAKENAGYYSEHSYVVWPMVKKGSYVLYASANVAAVTQASDFANGNIPNASPSNHAAKISGAVLKDGTEVFLDMQQAAVVNGAGVGTYINMQGWKLWGNYSAAYPDNTDPKDKFWSCRRFFTWHGNKFITTYLMKCDEPANRVLIDGILDEEQLNCNGYVASGACAGASIELDSEKNSVDSLIDGKLYFKQKLTPFPPAQEIVNTLSYDPDALTTALSGGEE